LEWGEGEWGSVVGGGGGGGDGCWLIHFNHKTLVSFASESQENLREFLCFYGLPTSPQPAPWCDSTNKS
jgi:hypothetical protein